MKFLVFLYFSFTPDTDLIIPKQFLKSIKRTGFGPNLFDELRYTDPYDESNPSAERRENPDFTLNQSRFAGATILLGRENFTSWV